jgi:protein O-mannosyl-transferase
MSEQESMPFTSRKAIGLIVLIGIVVYFTVLFNGFAWDDYSYIVNNIGVHTFNLTHLFGPNELFNSSGYYRPITAVYYSIIYSLFGAQPFYYHFFQLALHIINVCLVFCLLKRFFTIKQSFSLAIAFLIHPIQVESVAFISASLSELLLLFGMSALLISIKEKIHLKHYLVISVLLLLSLLTKETGFLFFIIVLLSQILFTRKRSLVLLPYLATSLGSYLYLRFVLAKVILEKDIYVPIANLSLGNRLINIPEIILYYVKTLFYPAKLAIDQLWTVTSIDFQHFYFPLSIDILFIFFLGLIGIHCYKRNKELLKMYLFFVIWFVAGLGMLLQIYPIDLTVADRWMYFPFVGLLGLIGLGIKCCTGLNKTAKKISVTIFIIACLFMGLRTIVRIGNWHDDYTLNSHDAAVLVNYDLENNLGVDLLVSGKCKDALPHFAKSIKLSPNDVNLSNLGLADACLKRVAEAKGDYMQAMSANAYLVKKPHKHFIQIYVNVINFFILDSNDPNLAKKYIYIALQDYPNTSVLYHYLAAAEYMLGNVSAAEISEAKANLLHDDTSTGFVDVYKLIKSGSVH